MQWYERPAGAVTLLCLTWGLAMAVLWQVAAVLAWPDCTVPAIVCAAAMMAGPCRAAGAALTETFTPRRRALRWLGLALLTGLAALLLARANQSDPQVSQLSNRWRWLWPEPRCRVLLLMPLWAGWSMLTLGHFHRPGSTTGPAARAFASTVHPVQAAGALLPPLAGSLVLLNFLFPLHFVPPLAAATAGLGGGTLIVFLRRGLTRPALLATGLLTQLAFLLAYALVDCP